MREGMLLPEYEDGRVRIIDVGGLPLATLLSSDSPALASTMSAVVAELVGPADNYSAHGSTPSP